MVTRENSRRIERIAIIVTIDREIAFQKCSSGNCCTNSWSKIQQRIGMVGSTWLLKPFSFFSSSTQTKLFYLTLLSFCVRDFSLTEQCSQPLMFSLMFVVLFRGHLPLFASHFFMML